MYGAFHETDDSTTVNLSAYGRFLQDSGSQLLTIGAKYLRLFRINPYALLAPYDRNGEWLQKTKLECVYSIRFLSPVKALAVARIPLFPQADSLLLAFDDAKLSVVAVDGSDRSLRTISLHSFEDDVLKEGYTRNAFPPIVRADPESRCGVMLVYGRHLAVLPFTEGVGHMLSYTIKLSSIDSRLENVVDMVFLEGYYEPTLVFLYEPLQTTAGRASIRSDTFLIMGVSLNTMDKQHAVIWQINGLPMSCLRLQAIPQPIGGCVVFGANEIIYLNQSAPPCGVAVNSCNEMFTKFPLRDMRHLSLSLDASESTVVQSGRMVFSTREGLLYLLSLIVDSTNTVKEIDIKQVHETSYAYTLTSCAAGHLFVGSRLGDSQLLSYEIFKEEVEEESESKRMKVDEELDEDDLELYGEVKTTEDEKLAVSKRVVERWNFEELDRLVNTGPILSMTAGAANNLSPDFSTPISDPVFDIVTSAGKGKEGSICVLQRTFRPEILSTNTIDGAEQLWAVSVREDESNRYLIVSRSRSTIVFELGEEWVELVSPLFITEERTIAGGELADGAIAVQVTSKKVALVAGEEQLSLISIHSNFPVMTASIVDPYVALLTQNGRLILYKYSPHFPEYLEELDLLSTPLGNKCGHGLSALCVYRDMSGLTVKESSGGRQKREKKIPASQQPNLQKGKADLDDLDDILLYGSKKDNKNVSLFSRKRRRGVIPTAQSAAGGEESDAIDPNSVSPSYWLVVARNDGMLCIYELPTISLVYQMHKMWQMPDFLHDTTAFDEEKEKKDAAMAAALAAEKEGEEGTKPEERIAEVCLTGMGFNQGRPVLFAVVDDLLVAYEMFSADNDIDGHLCVRFVRLRLSRSMRAGPFIGADMRRAETDSARENIQCSLIHPFERIGAMMHGVMLSGPNACLVVMSPWGGLTAHPFLIDGHVFSFTPVNDWNVSEGFLYLLKDSLRVARVQKTMDYELPYPTRKILVKKTVHFVRYSLQSQVYTVVTSESHRSNRLCSLVNEEKQIDAHPRPDSFICPETDEYAIDLYSDEDWKAVPNTGITLQEMEVVTACEEVLLRSESTLSGYQNFIACGTICNYGEEVLIRGRILLMEVIEVVPEPGMPTSKHKMKVLYDKEQKGPVTSLCAWNGYLLSGMGQKVFIWQFRDNNLQGISFLDMHYYVNHMASIRTVAICCDIFSSLSLIRFQEEFKVISRASRDERRSPPPPMSSAFLLNNQYVGFLLSDEAGNLSLFHYLPKDNTTGEKLLLRAAINIGTNVNSFLRVKGFTSSLSDPKAEIDELRGQQTTLWASLDGSIGYVRPVSEKPFRRLFCLQNSMSNHVPQAAGLHPRGSRVARPIQKTVIGESARNSLDLDVVMQFLHLSTQDKQELARKLGGNKYQLMDDLIQLKKLSTSY